MGFSRRIITIATAALVLSTPVFAQETPTKETVIVVVNGTDITLGHVLSLASRLPDKFLGVPDKDLFAGIVDQLIQQELLSGLITEEPEELKLAIENEYRALVADEAIQGIYATALSEEAIQERYKTLYQDVETTQEYSVRHILVETEAEAKEIGTLLADGGDFAQLAKDKSTGPTSVRGGDLGWVGLGLLVPEFEAAMVQMKPDEVSGPVKTQFGWHVIKLVNVRDKAAPELAVVLSEIEEALKAAALDQKIAQLESSENIVRNAQEIDPSYVKKFELLKD